VTTSSAARRRRLSLPMTLALLGASSWTVGGAIDVFAADPAFPVAIAGSGDSDNLAEFTEWQDEMFFADQPTDVSYFQRGTAEGRRQLLSGSTDFTLSGVPFTAAELAARPAGAGEIIDAPISVSSLSILFAEPFNLGWRTQRIKTELPECDPNGDDFDETVCIETGAYSGPIRIPQENLAAMILGLSPEFQSNALVTWRHPGIIQSFGTNSMLVQLRAGLSHTFVNRTEASAASRSLLMYAQELGPTAWALRKVENPQFAWETGAPPAGADASEAPVPEVFSPRTVSRFGAETQMGVMAILLNPQTNAVTDQWTGNAGAVPTTYVGRFLTDFPAPKFRVAEIQNAAGEWVTPTPAAVQAAISAGTSTNVAAEQAVPGAYPLTWVNRLYTVAGTLDPDQANAMAAFVRYVTTDGQQQVVADGGVALTAALRAESLAAANRIVEANCPSATHQVVTGGPSAFEPDTPQVQALTGLKHCELKPAPTTTTSTTTTTTTVPTASTSTTTPVTTTTVPTATTSTSVVASSPVVTSFVPTFNPSPVVPIPNGSPGGGIAIPDDETTTETSVESSETSVVDEAEVTDTSVAAAGGPAPAAEGGAGTRPRGRALDRLPMEVPSDGSEGFKKLGTLMLGAALFLSIRSIVTRRRASA
jgi:ABC-type phosphate transport system substrate-binding protein